MSAREELYAFGMSGKEHSPDNSERMSERIDAYAHELAEKIRLEIRRAETLAGSTRGRRIRVALLGEAADLIDPEVT